MTPDEPMMKRRKYKRELRRMARDEGLEEVILEMAVDQKETRAMVIDNDKADKAHWATPAHKAHPWTRESFIYVMMGILGVVGVASAVAGQVPIPGVGG